MGRVFGTSGDARWGNVLARGADRASSKGVDAPLGRRSAQLCHSARLQLGRRECMTAEAAKLTEVISPAYVETT